MLKQSGTKAFLVGGGIGSLAAAAFLIRDAGFAGENITIFEAGALWGGSLDAAGEAATGYSMRGGRMLTTDNYECTWDLFKSIPSLTAANTSVFDETIEFNKKHVSQSMARLVDRRRAKVPVTSMGFSMQDRMELLKLSQTSEETLDASRITDWLSPKQSSGTCGLPRSPFNLGIALWNLSGTCFVLSWNSPELKHWAA